GRVDHRPGARVPISVREEARRGVRLASPGRGRAGRRGGRGRPSCRTVATTLAARRRPPPSAMAAGRGGGRAAFPGAGRVSPAPARHRVETPRAPPGGSRGGWTRPRTGGDPAEGRPPRTWEPDALTREDA